MLLSLLRPAIRGNIPLIVVVATIQRSGKGALCAIIEALMTGTNASSAQYSPDPEEFRKALLPYVSRGQPIIRLDNIDDGGKLRSPHLSSAITEGWYADRVLGQSEIRSVPVRSIFLTTGNKITVSRDLLYRVLWIRLAPETDQPDKRTFAIDEIEAHVREHRAEYLTALATMVEHWKATGAKPWRGRRWNSFNPFVQTVGGVLEACGIEGFLGNADEQRAAGNPGETEWRRVLGCWRASTGEFQPANWLLKHVFDPCEPLAHIRIGGKTEIGRGRSLSRLLGKEVGRPRSMADGAVVHIAKSRNTHGNRDLFGLVTRARGSCEHSPYRHDYPRTLLARIRPPLGRGEDNEQSEDSSDPCVYEKTRCQCHSSDLRMEPGTMFYRGRGPETSGLCSLSSPALSQQGLTRRAKCEHSDPAPRYARTSSPEPAAPLTAGRREADAASDLPPDWRDWPEDIRVEFEEMAGIKQHDAGMSRDEAERAAEAEVRARYARPERQSESEVA
jgi:hypothetical protein